MNKREVGSYYEKKAAAYLRSKNYRILAQNYRSRGAEIDLIARDGEYLCFVEVKYRASSRMGYAAEAVDAFKQRKISQAARYYMMRHGISEWTPCRFDIVAFDGEQITHLKNAFEYQE